MQCSMQVNAIDTDEGQLAGSAVRIAWPAVRCDWVGTMGRRRTTPAPLTSPSSPQCPRSAMACSRTLLRRPCCPEAAAGSRPGEPEVQRPLPETGPKRPSRAAAAPVAAGGSETCCLLAMLQGAGPAGRCWDHVLQLLCGAEALQEAGACCLEDWLKAAGHSRRSARSLSCPKKALWRRWLLPRRCAVLMSILCRCVGEARAPKLSARCCILRLDWEIAR